MTTLAPFALAAAQNVTWIKVEKPVFDLVGVVIYSLSLAGICALVALALGGALGVAFILRNRRKPRDSWADRSLHLLDARRP